MNGIDSLSNVNNINSEKASKHELEEIFDELKYVRFQLDNERVQSQRLEQALKQQQNSVEILINLVFVLSYKWNDLLKNEIVSEEKSIFPVNSKLNPVFQFIEENYNQQITLSDVAKAVGYSCAYLTNRTKNLTDRTIYAWIVERRMTEARSLLIKTDQPVNQIATKIGYRDSGHFTRQFRQIHQIPPKAWRDKQRRCNKSISSFD